MAKTEITFVFGFDPACSVPKPVKRAGLRHRFAVVQQSYKPDSADMVFDEALRDAVLRFAAGYGEVSPAGRDFEARSGGELTAYVAFEEWAAIGGPEPYHDSYTYSIFTPDDVGERVMAFLATQREAENWSLASAAVAPPPRRKSLSHKSLLPKSLLQRLLAF